MGKHGLHRGVFGIPRCRDFGHRETLRCAASRDQYPYRVDVSAPELRIPANDALEMRQSAVELPVEVQKPRGVRWKERRRGLQLFARSAYAQGPRRVARDQ